MSDTQPPLNQETNYPRANRSGSLIDLNKKVVAARYLWIAYEVLFLFHFMTWWAIRHHLHLPGNTLTGLVYLAIVAAILYYPAEKFGQSMNYSMVTVGGYYLVAQLLCLSWIVTVPLCLVLLARKTKSMYGVRFGLTGFDKADLRHVRSNFQREYPVQQS